MILQNPFPYIYIYVILFNCSLFYYPIQNARFLRAEALYGLFNTVFQIPETDWLIAVLSTSFRGTMILFLVL